MYNPASLLKDLKVSMCFSFFALLDQSLVACVIVGPDFCLLDVVNDTYRRKSKRPPYSSA